MEQLKALAEPLAGKRVLHCLRDRVRRGRRRDPLHARPAHARRRASTPSGASSTARTSSSTSRRRSTTRSRARRARSRTTRRRSSAATTSGTPRRSTDSFDYVIVHDPQPAAMIDHARVLRPPLDLALPHRPLDAERGRARVPAPVAALYDSMVFHREEYVPHHEGLPPAYIWPPAIDPLTPKNMALSPEDASYIVDQFGIDVDRPLVTQVSRFDPWKDPLGVIEAWRTLRESHPRTQLALVGSMAHDDPEGWDYYNQTVDAAAGRPGHLHPLEPEQRRLRRGERVPGALRGARAEVDQGGLRPHGHRGALEGEADGGGPRRAGSSTRSRTARPATSSIPSRSAPRRCRRSSTTRRSAPDGASGQGVRARTSSPRLLRDWLALFNRLDGNDLGGAELVTASTAV